jgi:hypothetical protein
MSQYLIPCYDKTVHPKQHRKTNVATTELPKTAQSQNTAAETVQSA